MPGGSVAEGSCARETLNYLNRSERANIAAAGLRHSRGPNAVRMAEEIQRRVWLGTLGGLEDFLEIYLKSEVENCLGVLHFLEYWVIKCREQQEHEAAQAELEEVSSEVLESMLEGADESA